ncbi:bifunctional nicotinamidase/pyrazinamidase [Desertivirga arenae]|uniref:bifunctional nicotinamidase/pyrazinamidase n=1 Tax=Desertivirga arenae TaxID=2810309 RepID=UPI001A96FDF6|nr:bifunctional nicotinamidase/pyrazinamidase [Pedobacter sp. SYSU D00823]
MKALLIIDVQNDFLPGGALAVPFGNEIIPIINSIQDKFDLVVATQDWHPLNHKSFASNHDQKTPFDVIELNGIQQELWPDHCIQTTFGAQLSSEMDWRRSEAIIRKGTNPDIDSYSAFYDNGHLKPTGLTGLLRNRSVTEVYVAGLAADYCVYFTALDAITEGFRTYYIQDATRAINQQGFEKAKKQLSDQGCEVINSIDL